MPPKKVNKSKAELNKLHNAKRREIYHSPAKKAEREKAKMEKDKKESAKALKSNNKTRKGKKNTKKSPSPSPTPSPVLSESPVSHSNAMAVDTNAESGSVNTQSFAPPVLQPASLPSEHAVPQIEFTDHGSTPWNEGLDHKFLEEAARHFSFHPGLEYFANSVNETADAEEDMSVRGAAAGMIGNENGGDEEMYDSPSPSAEAAARSSFDGRSSIRSQRRLGQSMVPNVENRGQGHRSNNAQPLQPQNSANAYPRFDAQHAQDNMYAVRTPMLQDEMEKLVGQVINKGNREHENLRSFQARTDPHGLIPNQQLQQPSVEHFLPRSTPAARAEEERIERYNRAGIPLETQEQIAARVEELLQDKPVTDEEFAFMFLGDDGNGGVSVNRGQVGSSTGASSMATGMNASKPSSQQGPTRGLTFSEFLAARKEHSDYAIRNGETPPSYAYTGFPRPTPHPSHAQLHNEERIIIEASSMRRMMRDMDPERLALYDRKLAFEKRQKSKAAKKEACKEYDALMDRNMHDMSHHEGCNCSTWVTFELDAENDDDGDDGDDDWDAIMAGNRRLDDEIYEIMKNAQEIEDRRSGGL